MKQLVYLLVVTLIIQSEAIFIEQCPKLNFIMPKIVYKLEEHNMYYIGKIYEKPKSFGNLKNAETNTANTSEPQASVSYINSLENGKSFVSSFIYDSNSDKITYYQESRVPLHEDFAIYRTTVFKAYYIKDSNKYEVTETDNFARNVFHQEGNKNEPYAIVAAHQDMKSYQILANCYLRYLLIIYHEDVVKNNKMGDYDLEITKKLEDLKYFKFEDLKNNSMDIPFDKIPPSILKSAYTPVQTRCSDIKALPALSKPNTETQVNTDLEWYVVRVIPNDEEHSEDQPHYCTAIDHTDGCQGISVTIQKEEKGIRFTEIKAYNSKTNTLAVYNTMNVQKDDFFDVIKADIIGMDVAKENQDFQPLEAIPEKILNDLSKEYVGIAADEARSEYILKMTCDKKHSWLLVESKALPNLSTIEATVQEKVKELEYVAWDEMVKIPLEIPKEKFPSAFNLVTEDK